MSSRALRKLQRQQEEEQRIIESDSDESDSLAESRRPVFNAFDLLNAGGEEEEEEEEEEEGMEEGEGHEDEADENDGKAQQPKKSNKHTQDQLRQTKSPVQYVKGQAQNDEQSLSTAAGKRKKKSKKNKKNKKGDVKKTATPAQQQSTAPEVDEIDRALQQLSTNDAAKLSPCTGNQRKEPTAITRQDDASDLCDLLAIDSRSLNAINEMKKLFGNIVLQNESSSSSRNRRSGRSNINQPRFALDLGTALTGRFSPASQGKDFAGAAMKRNVLMQSKDDWPWAPSGGLGMEVVEKRLTGSTLYRLVYHAAYRDVQTQFEMAVESMQPEALIRHLQFNPYHLSTLLQVSEIAKHQGDHAVSADLLERALFNIGRSVHSSFSSLLKEGRARLSFEIKENRELWLTAWRYILNLGMKGTWRTAYEWAKLLLSLQPDDPYCISLILDSLAIRGRQQKHFVDLCAHPFYNERWNALPSIQCTLALAYLILGDEAEGTRQLKKAIARYPWIFCRIAQEYNIDPIPKSIWGAQAPNDEQHLFAELYLERSKDLWNRPEALELIKKVANSIKTTILDVETPGISLDIARHVILSDCRSAMTYIPRHFVSGRMSASDPLPPGYDPSQDTENGQGAILERLLRAQPNLLQRLQQQQRMAPRDEQGQGAGILPVVEEDERGIAREPVLQENVDVDGRSAVYQTTEWLYSTGLRNLQTFLNENGIDPGNWGDDVDVEPITEWVEALRVTDPVNWDTMISTVADQLGSPLIADLLQEELDMQEGN
ncbi:hypothetical protein KEM54_003260 [Ascosphaera aggregata]|nr:hypothetical protein KEM54_003260 [Ascosphaera aggregata]